MAVDPSNMSGSAIPRVRGEAYQSRVFPSQKAGDTMSKKAIFVRLEAKPGMEAELKSFLESALPLAEKESFTKTWFALQFDSSTFGIFDTFECDHGRLEHLNGPIAAALLANADKLLAVAPKIEKVDVMAAKVTA
jgi:hypothetical protein